MFKGSPSRVTQVLRVMRLAQGSTERVTARVKKHCSGRVGTVLYFSCIATLGDMENLGAIDLNELKGSFLHCVFPLFHCLSHLSISLVQSHLKFSTKASFNRAKASLQLCCPSTPPGRSSVTGATLHLTPRQMRDQLFNFF